MTGTTTPSSKDGVQLKCVVVRPVGNVTYSLPFCRVPRRGSVREGTNPGRLEDTSEVGWPK